VQSVSPYILAVCSFPSRGNVVPTCGQNNWIISISQDKTQRKLVDNFSL